MCQVAPGNRRNAVGRRRRERRQAPQRLPPSLICQPQSPALLAADGATEATPAVATLAAVTPVAAEDCAVVREEVAGLLRGAGLDPGRSEVAYFVVRVLGVETPAVQFRVCVCVCVHACVRACVGACVRACVRACVCASVCT